jgi:ubiquinone/menaquinone biosynthesis C-methylase UbiE
LTADLTDLRQILALGRFPRSAKYDPEWVFRNAMGPHPLWLTEWLCEKMDLKPGMRVLDLGCGKAITSIFLAREFDVHVWATDLWIKPTENWKRIRDAGLEAHVTPIYADARSLPYAEGFFDAVVCVDSYIYYGTDDLYLDYLVRFARPGSQIGMVVPGFTQALEGPLPEHLKPFWAQECWTWHPAEWWHHLWARTGLVDVECAENMPEAWEVWHRSEEAESALKDPEAYARGEKGSDAKVIEADQGRHMGFIRMVGRTKEV